MTTRIPVGVFFALFTVSGFAGLIYESIWSHYLKLFLGHAAYAQTLVLGIFMGGMAIGSWLVSRYTDRIRNLLLGYAFAELGIGLLAVVFHSVFQALIGWAFDSVIPALGGSGAVDAFKWSLASLLILPASILLGTTFPLMSAGIIRLYPGESGRALSMLYFTNSLGASIGVLASGFYLIGHLGLPGTILTAGILNVTLALVVWAITKRLPEVRASLPGQGAESPGSSRTAYRTIILLAFATGAASFIYEITWIRMLTSGLGASTHAFEVMLAAFILGMSVGGFALRNRIARLENDAAWLAGILVAKGLLAVYAIWMFGYVLEFIRWTMSGTAPTDAGYALFTVSGLAASMLVMFPTAFCAGMTLPLATHALVRRGHGERSIGIVYGANTLGCIVGAAFTTHLGMEMLGIKGLTGVGAGLDIAVGALLIAVLLPRATKRATWLRIAAAACAGVISFSLIDLDVLRMSSGVFRSGRFMDPSIGSVQWYKDGRTASISVTREYDILAIRTNGKPDASIELVDKSKPTADEATMVLAAAIPIAMKPEARDFANIGFGSGMTTHSLLASPNARVVDSIEIERAMVEGARAFGARNRRAYDDPRSRIHIEDAKTFFASHAKTYDVIVSEPSNPWVSGVSTLFSDEFYGQIRRYLKDDGLLVQWIQVYEINPALVATVFQALGKHFSDYVTFVSSTGDTIVVAAKTGKVPPIRPDIMGFPDLVSDLALLGFRGALDIEATRVAGRDTLEPLFRRLSAVPNSDYFPVLDQNAARSRFKRENATDLQMLAMNVVPLVAFVEGERRRSLASLAREVRVVPLARRHAETSAEALEIFLHGKSEGPQRLEPMGRTEFLLARAGLTDCSVVNEQWFETIVDLLGMTMPLIARVDIAAAFSALRRSPCAKLLSDDQRRRLDLLEAINDRDPLRMRDHALAILGTQARRKSAEQMNVVLAAMVGCIATGQADRAVKVWDAYTRNLPAALTGNVAAQLVLAHAIENRDAAKAASPGPAAPR